MRLNLGGLGRNRPNDTPSTSQTPLLLLAMKQVKFNLLVYQEFAALAHVPHKIVINWPVGKIRANSATQPGFLVFGIAPTLF